MTRRDTTGHRGTAPGHRRPTGGDTTGHRGTPPGYRRPTGGHSKMCLRFALATAGSFLSPGHAASPRPHGRYEQETESDFLVGSLGFTSISPPTSDCVYLLRRQSFVSLRLACPEGPPLPILEWVGVFGFGCSGSEGSGYGARVRALGGGCSGVRVRLFGLGNQVLGLGCEGEGVRVTALGYGS